MKYRIWRLKILKKMRWLNQRGQSIVEFVLLLAVITSISYGFVAFMNTSLKKYWQHSANLVINDNPRTKTVTLE